ncbi:DUF4055 domain-containing protein [Orrella sp. JC864]|uniref:DUF4055 domain-containing protein n=1 Tax=Orrella sp. JC864 TaxID=3120298 RepID=UPI00300A1166
MPVTTPHPDYIRADPDWTLMDDALEGERAVKARNSNLPKPSGMAEAEKLDSNNSYLYAAYTERAVYPHWVKDGLRTMVGLVSRLQPEIELPERMADMELNATADGFGLRQLFLRVVAATLAYGRKVLLTDVDAAGRPYIALYGARDAINWKTAGLDVDGRQDLVLAVLKESRPKDVADEFSHEAETVYRVLDMVGGGYRVRVMRDNGSLVEEEARPGMYGADGKPAKHLSYLPIIFCGSIDNAPSIDEIPLLTMAKAAQKYYQLSADYHYALHQTAHPQPWISGLSGEKTLRVAGPAAAWVFDNPEASCGYLEISGTGIEAQRTAMEEQRNAALEAGARVIDTRGAESGDARRARQDDQHASLHSVVMTAAEAIEQALRFAAEWIGADPEKVKFTVKPDFGSRTVDPAVSAQLLQAAMAGKISNESYWLYLSTGKLPEHDYQVEAVRIEMPGARVSDGDD